MRVQPFIYLPGKRYHGCIGCITQTPSTVNACSAIHLSPRKKVPWMYRLHYTNTFNCECVFSHLHLSPRRKGPWMYRLHYTNTFNCECVFSHSFSRLLIKRTDTFWKSTITLYWNHFITGRRCTLITTLDRGNIWKSPMGGYCLDLKQFDLMVLP